MHDEDCQLVAVVQHAVGTKVVEHLQQAMRMRKPMQTIIDITTYNS